MNSTEFKNLFLSLQSFLYSVAFKLLGDRFEAEDAVQNLYVRLWEQRKELHKVIQPQAYCSRLMRNICIDRLRLIGNFDEASIETVNVIDENLSSFEKIDERRFVHIYIDSLPLQQRRMLQMRMSGCTYEEIASATGITEVGVRVAISRLRKQFKKYLNNK